MKKSFLYTLGALALAASLSACGGKRSPGWEYAPQMYHSFAPEPYAQTEYNKFFVDGKSAQDPVAGTVARGKTEYYFPIPQSPEGYEAAAALKNPVAWSPEVEAQGKQLYTVNCQHCHGEKGDGQGKVPATGKYPNPPSYYGPVLSALSDGQMFYSITYGKNAMGSHASQLTPTERWKVIHYIHKLQADGKGGAAPAAADTTKKAAAPASATAAK